MAERWAVFSCLIMVLLACDSCLAIQQSGFNSDGTNVLLLMADQMRSDMLGSSGNKITHTPNLDLLASEGVRFTNAFSSTPTCTPARAALLTGLSPWYHGMLGYGVIAKRYNFELPRAFSSNGYYATSIGKDHFDWDSVSDEGIDHGFNATQLYDGLQEEFDNYDKWFSEKNPGVDPMATGLTYNDYRGRTYVLPEYYHPTAWVGRSAVEFIESYNRSQPFLLKVSFHRPHSPYDPPGRWMNYFKPEDMPAAYVGGNWDERYAIHYDHEPNPGIWCGDLGTAQVQLSRQAYYASVAFVDEWIGYIMAALSERGMLENTFILFTADHGDMMGDHYHWRKGYPYFGSASIPMLLRWTKAMDHSNGGKITTPRGTVKSDIVEIRDILPTFLDAANITTPDTLNGSSLLELLTTPDASSTWRSYIDLEHDICYNVTNHWNALTDGHFKYIFQAYFGDEQLFDLDSDPGELNNLAGNTSYQATLLEWRSHMVKQFIDEGRGDDWVDKQTLQLKKRVEGQLYSPYYPKNFTNNDDNLTSFI